VPWRRREAGDGTRDDDAPVTEGTSDGLSLLLGEFDRDLFFARHWERRSLHLRHGDASRFADLVSHESFFAREIGRCQHLKASTRDGTAGTWRCPSGPSRRRSSSAPA
jgi:hypothetical protein